MGRKVFITTLGKNGYQDGKYESSDNPGTIYTEPFPMLAIIKHLKIDEWDQNNKIIVGLTKEARESHWHSNSETEDSNKTIKQLLEEKIGRNGSIIKDVHLAHGSTKEEVWEIFSTLFKELKKGDEIYIDVTNGFRYFPMYMLMLCNYAKLLLDVKVMSIAYGGYAEKDSEIRPIVDVTYLSDLDDWTTAASDFISSGNAKLLYKLMNRERGELGRNQQNEELKIIGGIVDGLYSTTQNIRTVRGVSLYQGDDIKKFKDNYAKLKDNQNDPYIPILEKIHNSFDGFVPEKSVINGFQAAKWAFDNDLILQGYALYTETFISWICERASFDTKDRYLRGLVSPICQYIARNGHGNEHACILKFALGNPTKQKQIHILYHDPIIKEFGKQFGNHVEQRNDLSHTGWREQANQAQRFESHKKNVVNTIDEILKKIDTPIAETTALKSSKEKYFINISNHPSSGWDACQLDEAKTYGEVVDYLFPDVTPDKSHEDIQLLAKSTVDEIVSKWGNGKLTVHLMGEMTFTYALIHMLKERGIHVLASTTKRNVEEGSNGKKTSFFQFIKFREY